MSESALCVGYVKEFWSIYRKTEKKHTELKPAHINKTVNPGDQTWGRNVAFKDQTSAFDVEAY